MELEEVNRAVQQIKWFRGSASAPANLEATQSKSSLVRMDLIHLKYLTQTRWMQTITLGQMVASKVP